MTTNRRELMLGALALPAVGLLKGEKEREWVPTALDVPLMPQEIDLDSPDPWLQKGPPHWFRYVETLERGETYFHFEGMPVRECEPVRILDYWHCDGLGGAGIPRSRFYHVRVDSLATAKQLVADYGDVGLDKFWAAEEYKPLNKAWAHLAEIPVVKRYSAGYFKVHD